MRERSNAEKLLMLLVGVCAVLLIIDTSINLIAKYAAGQALSELQTRLGNSQTNPTSSAGAAPRATTVPLEPLGSRRGTPNDGLVEVYFSRECGSFYISYKDAEGDTQRSQCKGDYALLPYDVKSFTFRGSTWTLE